MSHIYLGGSRSLPPSNQPLRAVVSSILASGRAVHVGCATGADQQVIEQVIRSNAIAKARVFAAFASPPACAGWWSGSAVQAVLSFAGRGGQVSWLAGGGLQVPLVARLMGRSVAGLRGASAAVFFAPGVGSLKVAAHAVQSKIPVYAFSVHAPQPPRGCSGQWVAAQFAGQFCWSWQSAQLSFI